jgi:hypothetical protein
VGDGETTGGGAVDAGRGRTRGSGRADMWARSVCNQKRGEERGSGPRA